MEITCALCHSSSIHYFASLQNHPYYLCEQCKTLQLQKPLKTSQLAKYYKNSFTFINPSIYQDKAITQARKILHTAQRMNSGAKTLLDVGSGYGFLLNEAQRAGLNAEGIEPSVKLYTYSKKQYRAKVQNTTLELFSSKKTFDIITACHIIEHVPHPKKFITTLLTKLNRGGVLYIETPNSSSHLFNAEKENYTFFIFPEHLWIFSPLSLPYIIEATIKKITTYSEPEHVMGIIKKKLKKEPKTKPVDSIKKTVVTKAKTPQKKPFIDTYIAPLITPFFNYNNQGSIMGIYIQKT